MCSAVGMHGVGYVVGSCNLIATEHGIGLVCRICGLYKQC